MSKITHLNTFCMFFSSQPRRLRHCMAHLVVQHIQSTEQPLLVHSSSCFFTSFVCPANFSRFLSFFFRAASYASTPGCLAKLRAPTRRDIAKKEIGQSSGIKTAYTHCQCTLRDTASANITFGAFVAFHVGRVPAGLKFYHLV